MAEQTQRNEPHANGHATAVATGPAKPLPPGVILGPDGRPCRACSTKTAFSALAKSMRAPASTSSTAPSSTQSTVTTTLPTDCPADVETLGRSTWTLLHSVAATYPTSPSSSQQDDLVSFVRLFSRLYPCWVCADDFRGYIDKDPVKAGSRGEFGKWLCDAHNDVNKKLGKPVFDCSRWEERWRTGWKDGRCD